MNYKTEILDMIDVHVVMQSLFRDGNSFGIEETPKYINVNRNGYEYFRVWFVEPIIIRFGNYTWRRTPPKKYGLNVGSLVDHNALYYVSQNQIVKFNKFSDFKYFFERYIK